MAVKDQYNNTSRSVTTRKAVTDDPTNETATPYKSASYRSANETEYLKGTDYHLRVGELAKSDVYGLTPCCDSWEAIFLLSVAQKVLSNPRWSQYFSKRNIDCIEKKTGATYPRTIDCPSVLSLWSQADKLTNGNVVLSGTVSHSASWEYEVVLTPNGVNPIISRSGSFFGVDVPAINIGQPVGGETYSIYERWTDTTNGCVYCFIVHNVLVDNQNGWETGGTTFSIPLFTGGDCPEYTSGGNQNGVFVDCNGVQNNMILSGIILDSVTIPVGAFPVGTVIKTGLTSGETCWKLNNFTTDATTNPPPLVTDDPYTNVGTACADCAESICDSLDPFLVELRVVSDTPQNQVVVTNATGVDWDEVELTLIPNDGIGISTAVVTGPITQGTFATDDLAYVDTINLYKYTIKVTIGACSYCASASELAVFLPIDGAGAGVGVANGECE